MEHGKQQRQGSVAFAILVAPFGSSAMMMVKEDIFIYTALPETNIAPENRPSQKETSIPTIQFQVLC